MAGKKLKLASKIIFVVYLLVIVFLVTAISAVDVLPMKYIYIGIGAIAALSGVIGFLVFTGKGGKKTKIAGLVLSILLILALVVGSVYLLKTGKFMQDITDNGKNLVEYCVVVRNDSDMQELKDIDGKDVYISWDTSKEYIDAQTKLTEDGENLDPSISFKYEYESTTSKLCKDILKKKSDVDVMFLHRGTYDIYCDDNDKLAENTRIIYSVYVEKVSEANAKAVDVTKDTYNVYITGLDTKGSIDIQSRSDVNMVMTVNPVTKKILLTSIPRDYYVKLHTYQSMDKLTHSGIYGAEETVATIEDLFQIDINYYVKCNFSTVVALVDAIDGVDVESEKSFSTHGRENTGYTFTEGTNHLDGGAALAFARERKSFAGGDRQRIKNQQLVVEAVLKKVSSSKTLLSNYGSILSGISEYLETSFTDSELKAIAKMQLGDMAKWDITKISVDGKGSSEPCYAAGNAYASVILQDEEDITKARDAIAQIYSGNEVDETETETDEE